MKREIYELIKTEYGVEDSIINMAEDAERNIREVFQEIDSIKEYNQLKVIKAMQRNNVSESHFGGTTGYGYDDRGREVLDRLYADVFRAEDALVRHNIVAGTHALALCLYGNLRGGEELLSVTGKPYDTLEEVIGIRGKGGGSLKDFGVKYRQVDLLEDGTVDYEGIKNAINSNTKIVYMQRSRGYSVRPSLKMAEIRKTVETVKKIKKDVIVLVDNCYGEFVEKTEPIEAGADIIAGSLIKNPGGGVVPAGGYVAGKKTYVKNAACRLTAPGLGEKVGPTLGNNRLMFQGLFLAPHIVAESLKGAVFCAEMMKRAGFEVSPRPDEKRGDIVQAIKFYNAETMIAFCQCIQRSSPVDAFVVPQPWDMPGYDCPVIMAAGTFIQGSSIELSADAPVRPPYVAYLQGGLTYEHVKLGIMIALQEMLQKGFWGGRNGS